MIHILHLCYLGESKKLEIPENALKFFIVRKPVNGIPKGFVHVPQLSPSIPLFDKVKCYWKEGLFDEKEKDYLQSLKVDMDSKKAWFPLYEREFNKELRERPDMVKAINRLKQLLDEKKEIYLFCYCKDVCFCHRRLVGEYVESFGYEVNYYYQEETSPEFEQLNLFD